MASLFKRKFVFLTPEDRGYEIAIGKTPKGHIEIERKDDRLSFKVFVENLKEMGYQIQLFTLGGRYLILDEMLVGSSGKAEGKYSTNSSNVLNSGINWQEFNGIVIRALGQDHSNKVPLVAWLKDTKGTREEIPHSIGQAKHGLKQDQVKNKEEKQILEEQLQEEAIQEEQIDVEEGIGGIEEIEEKMEAEEQPIEEIKEQEIHAAKETDPYSNLEEYWVDLDRESKEEYPQQKLEPVLGGDTESDLGQDMEPELDQELEYDTEEEPEVPYYYINQNIEQLQKAIPEINPFRPPMKNHKWWKIMKDQKDLEGYYLYYNGSFVNLTYPYMGYKNIGEVYVEKYNYMIFGMVFEDNNKNNPSYYVYGIPGRLCMQDQPFQGNTGFLYWHPAEDNSREKGAMGYWLLYVEAHSGIIAVPKRPTIAPICDN